MTNPPYPNRYELYAANLKRLREVEAEIPKGTSDLPIDTLLAEVRYCVHRAASHLNSVVKLVGQQ